MVRWSRRQVVQGMGVAGLALLAGCGRLPGQAPEPPRVYRVGFLSRVPSSLSDAFRDGLRDLGYVEGQNLVIEWRFSQGAYDKLPGFAREFVDLGVDVIVDTVGIAPQATTIIPIVMPNMADPTQAGQGTTLARPVANVTGLSLFGPDLSGKRLELLHESISDLSRVAVLSFRPLGAQDRRWAATQAAAEALGVGLQFLGVLNPPDIVQAFAAANESGAQAVLVLPYDVLGANTGLIVRLAGRHRLPAMYPNRGFVEVGGLMSYAPDYATMWRRAAYYVDRILKGTRPAELPIEQPTTFEFVINLKTAQALGLMIPQQVLLQATEVLQ